MGEVDSMAGGNKGTVIGVTITTAHDKRVRASEPGELRDTGVAPPAPLTVSRCLLAEVFWGAVSISVTRVWRMPYRRKRSPERAAATP